MSGMRHSVGFLLVVLLASCGVTEDPACQLPDTESGQDCSSLVSYGAGQWTVTLAIRVTDVVEYEDRGHTCQRTVTVCRPQFECLIPDPAQAMTATQAFARCRAAFEGS